MRKHLMRTAFFLIACMALMLLMPAGTAFADQDTSYPVWVGATQVYEGNKDDILGDGGSEVEAQTVKNGEKAAKPEDPTKDGFVFAGWQLNGEDYDFGDPVIKHITLKATWTEEEPEPVAPEKTIYTISYDLNGGTLDGKTGIVTVEAEEGSTITIPDAPTREGYTFTYWKGSEYKPGDEYVVEGDHTFTAQWEKDEEPAEPEAKPVAPTTPEPAVPKSGDATSWGMIAGIAAIGAAAVALSAAARRSKQF